MIVVLVMRRRSDIASTGTTNSFADKRCLIENEGGAVRDRRPCSGVGILVLWESCCEVC